MKFHLENKYKIFIFTYNKLYDFNFYNNILLFNKSELF